MSPDGNYIAYIPIADIVIKNQNNIVLKEISGIELQKQAGNTGSDYTTDVQYDSQNKRFLFTYDIFFGGYIELPSLNVVRINGEEYNTFLDTYFPYAGN